MTFGPLTMTTQGTHSMPVSPCFRHSTTAFPYTPPLPPSKSQPTTITDHTLLCMGNGEGQSELYRKCLCVCVQKGQNGELPAGED